VRDLMVAAVEHRFGPVNRLPGSIEWLTENEGGRFEEPGSGVLKGLGQRRVDAER
jgi:putative transposase